MRTSSLKTAERLQWAARMQKKAKSQGEKAWARREFEKAQKKIADDWVERLWVRGQEAHKGKAWWEMTPERRDYEDAKAMHEKLKRLQSLVKRRAGGQLEQIEELETQMQRQMQEVQERDAEKGKAATAAAVLGLELLA